MCLLAAASFFSCCFFFSISTLFFSLCATKLQTRRRGALGFPYFQSRIVSQMEKLLSGFPLAIHGPWPTVSVSYVCSVLLWHSCMRVRPQTSLRETLTSPNVPKRPEKTLTSPNVPRRPQTSPNVPRKTSCSSSLVWQYFGLTSRVPNILLVSGLNKSRIAKLLLIPAVDKRFQSINSCVYHSAAQSDLVQGER